MLVGAALIAFFVLIPVALTLIRGGIIANRMGRPDLEERFGRYQLQIKAFGVLPLAVVTFVLGVVLKGSSAHFTKPHEVKLSLSTWLMSKILGLIVFIQTIIAGILGPLVRTKPVVKWPH